MRLTKRTARAQHATKTLAARLSRVEDWRRARLQRLLTELSDDPDRRKAIRAARLYLEAGIRRQAIERGLIK
ncbi:hypothetical protein [Bradyrhizobium valentinum]|uniref:hypothetical protein n=1 Tax=Bradyrhizobium valentinum TaxID=1518501 RepID=UPI000710A696|nr:hypothetical protein [Bradyrhizobium valentinum]KRQ95441.1 hypothetical protein CQ10_32800 [Bradyrhizobium valentinum]